MALRGRKTDFKTRRVVSRGRKSKAGGGKKIKSDSIIYTLGEDNQKCSRFEQSKPQFSVPQAIPHILRGMLIGAT